MASAKVSRADTACRLVLALVTVSARAEQLPIRSYGPADGFPSKTVEAITRDSRGFLWFSTREGLAQFDGYEFRTYGKANGLPRDAVEDFLETRSGIYWAATTDGVARFDPDAPPAKKFTVYRPDLPEARRIRVLYQDRSGRVWCGTENGLFLINEDKDKRAWRLDPAPLILDSGQTPVDSRISSLFEDSRGNLWIGTFRALYLRRPDGHVSEFQVPPRAGYDFQWNAIYEDPKGRLWAGTGFGLWRILPNGSDQYALFPVFVPKRRLIIWSIVKRDDGEFWLGTSAGLMRWISSPDGLSGKKRIYTRANGITHTDVGALATDREGNLWLGTDGGGVMRLARNGFITYSDTDRVSLERHGDPTLFHDRSGKVYIAFHSFINVRQGDRFVGIAPAVPIPANGYPGWGWHQSIVRDQAGEWWFATGTGLVRFPNVPVEDLAGTHPAAVYTTRDGLQTSDIFRIFEDSRGGIWIGCIGPLGVNGLSRRDRSGSFQHFGAHSTSVASTFAEDRDHSVWIGYYDGALGRYRNGTFSFYSTQDGLAGGAILAVHVDQGGRLWIASTRGLTRLDSTAADSPQFRCFGTKDGLSSNVIRCLTEDRWGRIYLATGRGIDRIDATREITPARVRHYTEADGLTKGDLIDVLFDGNGDLWCSSRLGISRLTPELDRSRPPLPVLIRGLRIRGVPHALSDLGETNVPKLTFAPDQNQLQIDFSTLAFAPGEPIKYQYRLDPADSTWSEPSDQRTVNLSNVAPGSYRFSVRLVTAGVVDLQQLATLDFAVLAPIWQRWWFRLTATLAILSLIYWLHRYRTFQVLELERVRTRIATDLHDDIGSGLSQIAVLSEVARAQADGKGGLLSALSNIGNVSRELSESMSDIVWSVNPRRDRLQDLTQRMRRFASDVLSGMNIEFSFLAPSPEQALPLPVDVRREVFLIFKESINNLVRHSGCTRAEIVVSIADGWMNLKVEDDGAGFIERSQDEGNGLRSMNERAKRIGGTFVAGTSALGGVRVVLRVPLRTSVLRKRIPT